MELKLSKKEHLVLKKFKATLEKIMGKNFVEVKLFGSRACGDTRKDSDIDIFVITATGDWHMLDVVYDIATDILFEDEMCLSPKVINRKDYDNLCKLRTPFIKNIIRNGIAI